MVVHFEAYCLEELLCYFLDVLLKSLKLSFLNVCLKEKIFLNLSLNPKMDRGSTGSGLTTAKRGKNQPAGSFRSLEPTTLVMGTCNSKPELSCCV